MNKALSYIQILGPTATGKTDLAIALAQNIPSEIISVDSVMVYTGFDIGSAKPNLEERQGIIHHLIDIGRPDSLTFDGYQFCEQATLLIEDIHKRNKVPIVAGGTMLYAHLLNHIYHQGMPPKDHELRALLHERVKTEGIECLYRELITVKPTAKSEIMPNDAVRIIRNLEIEYSTQKQQQKPAHQLDPYLIHIHVDQRSEHISHMSKRFDQMIGSGFIDELEELHLLYQKIPHHPVFKSIGYNEGMQYLSGLINKELFIERSKIATRQYAKKQMTWLRSWKTVPHQSLQWSPHSPFDVETLTNKIKTEMSKH